MQRPDYLFESPVCDRTEWPQEWTTSWRVQVADLFCGRGGVGRVLASWLPRRMFFGVDIADFSEEYPGQFVRADLLDPGGRPFEGPVADLVWVSFPCKAYASPSSLAVGSAEAALDRYPRITDEFRDWLQTIAGHYIIENVPNAAYYGDLKANVRINGLGMGRPYDHMRVFETTFECPDAYKPGSPDVTISLDGNQSVGALADAKGVPSQWGKQGVRSAVPPEYVTWLLSHCPAVPWPHPRRRQSTLGEAVGSGGHHSMFGTGDCGGHKCPDSGCAGEHRVGGPL